MPKVLQLISSSGFYGADNVLIQLARELRNTQFMPIIGVFRNSRNPHVEVADVAKKLGFQAEIFQCSRRFDFRTIWSIRCFLRKQSIEIIHTHGYKSNAYGLFAAVGTKVQRVATCHNWLGDDIKMKSYASLDKMFLRRFNRVIAVSEPVKDELLRHNIAWEKVSVINNGIDMDRFADQRAGAGLRRELGIDEDFRVIGTVGRLSEEKGHTHLLDAAEKVLKRYPNVIFVIIGDGPLKTFLEEKAGTIDNSGSLQAEESKDPIVFLGVRNDMPMIYSLMDIFVLPSLTEGLPMVLLEAMASRKPIIATKVGAVSKVIEHGHSGILTNPGNVEELTNSILELLEHREYADSLGRHARERVEKEYSSNTMAAEYVKVYQDLLRSADYTD